MTISHRVIERLRVHRALSSTSPNPRQSSTNVALYSLSLLDDTLVEPCTEPPTMPQWTLDIVLPLAQSFARYGEPRKGVSLVTISRDNVALRCRDRRSFPVRGRLVVDVCMIIAKVRRNGEGGSSGRNRETTSGWRAA